MRYTRQLPPRVSKWSEEINGTSTIISLGGQLENKSYDIPNNGILDYPKSFDVQIPNSPNISTFGKAVIKGWYNGLPVEFIIPETNVQYKIPMDKIDSFIVSGFEFSGGFPEVLFAGHLLALPSYGRTVTVQNVNASENIFIRDSKSQGTGGITIPPKKSYTIRTRGELIAGFSESKLRYQIWED